MKNVLLAMAALILSQPFVNAQLTTPPNGGNKKATVAERLGLYYATFHYDSPNVIMIN